MLGNTRMFRTVTSSTHAYKDEKPFDLRLMKEEERQKAAMEATDAYHASLLDQVKEDEKKKAAMEAFNHIPNLNRLKALAYDATEKFVSDAAVAEAFSRIYINALPHDKDFVIENYNGLKNMATFYMRKLGGAKYLHQRAMESHNPFLMEMDSVCMEAAKKVKDKRKKKISSMLSEDEVREMISPKLNDEERDVIINNINKLGVDELSDLVKDKIINVVKDEHRREKEEREFRTVLKDDIQDPTLDMQAEVPKAKDIKKGGSIDTQDDEMLSDVEPVEDTKPSDTKTPKKSESEKPKKAEADGATDKKDSAGTKPLIDKKEDNKDDKKTAKESSVILNMDLDTALERWNPLTQNFQQSEAPKKKGLFFALCTSVYRDLANQKMAFENADMRIEKKIANESLMKNPLNLDIFNAYIKTNDNIVDTAISADFNEPEIYASTDPGIIDKDRIVSEALIQYGLLETAYTMHLIEPTVQQIREQCEFLLKRK